MPSVGTAASRLICEGHVNHVHTNGNLLKKYYRQSIPVGMGGGWGWGGGRYTQFCLLHRLGPLKPHFYVAKLGFTRVYIIFHISAQNIDCEYSLEPPQRGGSNVYPQFMF